MGTALYFQRVRLLKTIYTRDTYIRATKTVELATNNTNDRSPVDSQTNRCVVEFDTKFSATSSTYIQSFVTANTSTCTQVNKPLTSRRSPVHSSNVPHMQSGEIYCHTLNQSVQTQTTLNIFCIRVVVLSLRLKTSANTTTKVPTLSLCAECCAKAYCQRKDKLFRLL